LHVFKTTKPEDIAGDIISHRLVNDDPYLSKKYKEFKEVTSPEVMERRYEFHQKNLGEERAYDLWAETTGFPELLRGHVFNQFPEEAKDSLYTDEQKRILEDIKTRVTQPKEFNKGGMAVVKDELATYLDRLAPKNKDFLAKLYADKSPKEREAILGGMMLGDTEFQASVAPYLPEGTEVDATRARLQRLPESMRKDGLNYKGLVVSKKGNPKATGPAPETTKFFKAGENGVPDAYFEYGTANAIGAVNATPLVYSHELRHLLNLDGSSEKPSIIKDGMDYGETINRVQDVYAARTKSELGETILTLVNSLIKTRDANGQRPAGYADVQNRALNAVNNPANHTEDSLVELRDDILALPHIANVIEEYPQTMDKAVIGRYSKTPWHEKNITRPIGNLFKTPKEFNKGGTTMSMTKQMEMFEDGGLSDEGGTIDEMSGNDVPTGSLKEEVRDDIPAQLSEGEFVLPADVVRYHGLDKIMRLRDEAKAGIARMEAMGQMGNSEEAVLPDDMPFNLDDLEIDDDDETLEMAVGGSVPQQQQPYGVVQPVTPQATNTYNMPSAFTNYTQQRAQEQALQVPQPTPTSFHRPFPQQTQYSYRDLMPETVRREELNREGQTGTPSITPLNTVGTNVDRGGSGGSPGSTVSDLASAAAAGYTAYKIAEAAGVLPAVQALASSALGLGGANAAAATTMQLTAPGYASYGAVTQEALGAIGSGLGGGAGASGTGLAGFNSGSMASGLAGAGALAIPIGLGLFSGEFDQPPLQVYDKARHQDRQNAVYDYLRNGRTQEQYGADIIAAGAPTLPSQYEYDNFASDNPGDTAEAWDAYNQGQTGERIAAADAAFKKLHPDHWDDQGNIIPARIKNMPAGFYDDAVMQSPETGT
jgi:hypothetical protein